MKKTLPLSILLLGAAASPALAGPILPDISNLSGTCLPDDSACQQKQVTDDKNGVCTVGNLGEQVYGPPLPPGWGQDPLQKAMAEQKAEGYTVVDLGNGKYAQSTAKGKPSGKTMWTTCDTGTCTRPKPADQIEGLADLLDKKGIVKKEKSADEKQKDVAEKKMFGANMFAGDTNYDEEIVVTASRTDGVAAKGGSGSSDPAPAPTTGGADENTETTSDRSGRDDGSFMGTVAMLGNGGGDALPTGLTGSGREAGGDVVLTDGNKEVAEYDKRTGGNKTFNGVIQAESRFNTISAGAVQALGGGSTDAGDIKRVQTNADGLTVGNQ